MLTEQQEAEAFAAWLQIKKIPFTHVPLETGADPYARRRAVRMKRAGASRGYPDYVIHPKGVNIAVELKRKKNSKVSPEQRKWLEILAGNGFKCAICYGADEAIEFVNQFIEKERVEF